MAAFNPKAARRARRQVRRLRHRLHSYQRQARQAKQYDPLAPITGAREKQEMKAAERLQFGPRARELRQATADQGQTSADRAQYYDDYRQALREATSRVNEANRQNVLATEGRVDTAYQQDSAGVKARDAAASEAAAKLGRGPVQSDEGARAVAAQRSQGNQSAARLRGEASADTKYMELRGATSALAKAEDQSRQSARRAKLRQESKDLAQQRGDFRVDLRRKTRQDEREYAAVQKEFGLKRREQNLQFKTDKASQRLERQKLNAQKIVARIYASADKAGARAQIRVAKLQLQKGKISQHQYRRIVNIYHGLPGPGVSGGATSGGKGGPKLQTWEIDKVNNAMRILTKHEAHGRDKQTWLDRMQSDGLPLRLARIAWRRYAKRHLTDPHNDSLAHGGPGHQVH